MCIENDIRGNIKLSLKATLPQHSSQKKDSEKSAEEGTSEASISENQTEDDDIVSSIRSMPSIVIRSSAECDVQDISSGKKTCQRSGKGAKFSPRPYNPSNSNGSSSRKRKENKFTDRIMKESDELELKEMLGVLTKKDVIDDKPKTDSTTKVDAHSLKLGDRVTATIQQKRKYGLVLEIVGGLRGMYKFEVYSQHFLYCL